MRIRFPWSRPRYVVEHGAPATWPLPDGFEQLARETIAPLHLVPADELLLTYTEPDGTTHEVLKTTIGLTMTVDEAVAFVAPPGAFGEGRAIGGAFVEQAR